MTLQHALLIICFDHSKYINIDEIIIISHKYFSHNTNDKLKLLYNTYKRLDDHISDINKKMNYIPFTFTLKNICDKSI